ncbi:hypothetical protein [Streptomyces sp. NPDC003036]|uniref:hypothetical protein n=1 Tax=Streptomyces sp. NPDC003036 TaxID=3154442 RepID=UPI0033BA80B1
MTGRGRGGGRGLAWRAELTKALSPTVVVTMAVALAVAMAMEWYGYREAYSRFRDSDPVTAPGTVAGALWAASQQSGTLLGLVVIAALAAALYATESESGTWPLLLVARPGLVRLLARKLLCALAVSIAFTAAVALALFVSAYAAEAAAGDTGALAGRASWDPQSRITWGDAVEGFARSLVVQAVFAVVAFAMAAVTRDTVMTFAATLAPVLVAAPLVGIAGLTAFHPQAWAATWLHLSDEAQYSLYLWTREPASTATPGLWGLLGLAAAYALALAYCSRPQRL